MGDTEETGAAAGLDLSEDQGQEEWGGGWTWKEGGH